MYNKTQGIPPRIGSLVLGGIFFTLLQQEVL